MVELALAAHGNYLAARRCVGEAVPGGTVREEGGWLVLEGPTRLRGARAAVLEGVEGPATVDAISWATGWAGTTGALVLRDTDTWANRLAVTAGFRPEGHAEVAMASPLDRRPAGADNGVVHVRVSSTADLKQYVRLITEENGLAPQTALALTRSVAAVPGVELHLLKAEDVVVARSMTCTWDGVCGLYNVYVPPAFRGRGFGRAVSLASLEAGFEAGARLACLQANEAGLPLYRSMGFHALYHYLTLTKSQ
ncbi:MAG TPA: GNAT family N-acetyltransferase [Tepidiformaceae bacterium]|nr:GNAT family N-acetyltransferase [Tepidiformaceae bacterium]